MKIMKAKLVKESLNEDYYDENDLGLRDKIVDYIVGQDLFSNTFVDKDDLRKYYMSQINHFPDISERIMKLEVKDNPSIGEIIKTAQMVQSMLKSYNVLDYPGDDITWEDDNWSYDT